MIESGQAVFESQLEVQSEKRRADAAEDELAASKERIKQLYASHDRKDAKITDLRIRIENMELEDAQKDTARVTSSD